MRVATSLILVLGELLKTAFNFSRATLPPPIISNERFSNFKKIGKRLFSLAVSNGVVITGIDGAVGNINFYGY